MLRVIEGVCRQEAGDVERTQIVPVVAQHVCLRPRQFEPRHGGHVGRGIGLNNAPEPVLGVQFGNDFRPKQVDVGGVETVHQTPCLLYTSPSPRDATLSRMPSSA